jgi:hypothetical protein
VKCFAFFEQNGKPEIVLPRTDRLGDYPNVVSKLIAVFGKAAKCDELTMYRNLVGSACEDLRLHLTKLQAAADIIRCDEDRREDEPATNRCSQS